MGMVGNPRPEGLPRTCSRADGRPKKTFATEADARAYGSNALETYKCVNCTFWHLSSPRRKP